jgi:hypothetical protein
MWTLILITLLVTNPSSDRSAALATKTIQFSSSSLCSGAAKEFSQAASVAEFPKSGHSAAARYRIIAQCVQTSVDVPR